MADLNKSGREADLSRMLVIGPLVMAYLILDDLPPARFALIRLPHDLASQILPQALFNLLASTTDRKYTNVYRHTNELLDVLTQDPMVSGVDVELGIVLRSMLEKFLDAFRMRTFDLLRGTYTAIPLEKVQGYLGLEAEVVLQAAKNLGQWAYDANTRLLTPVPHSSLNITDSTSNIMTFHSVAGTAVQLESSI
ncbi:hypothetical protein BS47DRAFT_918663 [Hydnum rufescens UP504]|uniref:CSN8/PSMD8/EIF3K domain-containing protein n=1 Tax=Hydnum rufescens UP504 TaxID=1448309 RepID=A0A9P6E1S2_9AGAM|nr:hypothetical protein BS47DRAFT_918663 [Hydnum rufescens UP504]